LIRVADCSFVASHVVDPIVPGAKRKRYD